MFNRKLDTFFSSFCQLTFGGHVAAEKSGHIARNFHNRTHRIQVFNTSNIAAIATVIGYTTKSFQYKLNQLISAGFVIKTKSRENNKKYYKLLSVDKICKKLNLKLYKKKNEKTEGRNRYLPFDYALGVSLMRMYVYKLVQQKANRLEYINSNVNMRGKIKKGNAKSIMKNLKPIKINVSIKKLSDELNLSPMFIYNEIESIQYQQKTFRKKDKVLIGHFADKNDKNLKYHLWNLNQKSISNPNGLVKTHYNNVTKRLETRNCNTYTVTAGDVPLIFKDDFFKEVKKEEKIEIKKLKEVKKQNRNQGLLFFDELMKNPDYRNLLFKTNIISWKYSVVQKSGSFRKIKDNEINGIIHRIYNNDALKKYFLPILAPYIFHELKSKKYMSNFLTKTIDTFYQTVFSLVNSEDSNWSENCTVVSAVPFMNQNQLAIVMANPEIGEDYDLPLIADADADAGNRYTSNPYLSH